MIGYNAVVFLNGFNGPFDVRWMIYQVIINGEIIHRLLVDDQPEELAVIGEISLLDSIVIDDHIVWLDRLILQRSHSMLKEFLPALHRCHAYDHFHLLINGFLFRSSGCITLG